MLVLAVPMSTDVIVVVTPKCRNLQFFLSCYRSGTVGDGIRSGVGRLNVA